MTNASHSSSDRARPASDRAGVGPAVEAGIVARDADRLAAFYVDAFGLGVEHRFEFPQGIVVRLRDGAARVKIFQPTEEPTAATTRESWHRDAGFAYAAFHTDDVRSTVHAVEAAGGSVLTPPTEHRPGATYSLVSDPDGNVWELLSEAGDELAP